MPTANSSASKEVVTAALLVIGGKILSGRTKDQNIGYVAEYLTGLGIDLKEVRVVGDEECCASAMHRSSRRPNARSRTCWSECGKRNQRAPEHCRREPPEPTPPRVDRPDSRWAEAYTRCEATERTTGCVSVIPNPNDQNPWAHWRSPMDMMRQGWSTSLFHAAQQWSTRSS
jgi:hypothetical protein